MTSGSAELILGVHAERRSGRVDGSSAAFASAGQASPVAKASKIVAER
ncbi:MAG: hypothetical protein KY460_12110 [Actinobacteria bacterium]|nr:hypothetical protein [Actinomycetota bacterium]